MANFTVYRRDYDTDESLIRRFKKMTKKMKIIKRVRDKQFYIKPSEKRHREKMIEKLRHQKREVL